VAHDIEKSGVRSSADVSGIAAMSSNELTIMVWNYHDDDVSGPSADVKIDLNGLPSNAENVTLTQYRIDETHSNAHTVWMKMGSPQNPTPEQYKQMEEAGQLQRFDEPQKVKVDGGKTTLPVSLPRQAVALFVLSWSK
jgi:xylan 1,4-beta-xylosidase